MLEQSLGFSVALRVDGATATMWDGTAEKHLEFALESPCSATFTERSPSGSSSTTTHFTIKNGVLVAGLGDAGSRHGTSAIACVSNQILTLDDAGACLAWSTQFDEWKSKPAACGFAQRAGHEVFTATLEGADRELVIDGDAMMSDQLAQSPGTAFPDFAAAKAARDPKH